MIHTGSGAKPSCCGSLLSITSHRAHPKGGATVPHRGERSERASAGARGVCGVAHAVERPGATARLRGDGETARRGGTPWSGGPGGGARAVPCAGRGPFLLPRRRQLSESTLPPVAVFVCRLVSHRDT